MLIQIDDDLIISDSDITKILRMGNYTEIYTKEKFYQIWDKDKKLWNKMVSIGGGNDEETESQE